MVNFYRHYLISRQKYVAMWNTNLKTYFDTASQPAVSNKLINEVLFKLVLSMTVALGRHLKKNCQKINISQICVCRLALGQ